MLEVEVAIIGAGSAGMAAYRAATRHTHSLALIEGGVYGTTCARVGCIPSKLLIAAADAAEHVREADGFGVRAGAPVVDGVAVMRRVRAERDRFVGFVLDSIAGFDPAQRIEAHARFLDPHTLQLSDGRSLRARSIVIATGSRPQVPPEWRATLGERLIVNDDVFAWQDLPRSVAIAGAGSIGLELGQALQRLGVRVRVFARSERLGGLTDPIVNAHAANVLGATLPLSQPARIVRVAREADQVHINWLEAGVERSERFDFLLAALGRTPNVEGLNLAAAGIELDVQGVPRNDPATTQAGGSHIFLAGDVVARRMILHEAADEGRIAGDNAARFPDVRRRPRRSGLAITFVDPQIAIAGASHAELLARGVRFAAAQLDFADQGRSRIMRRNRGLIRVYGEIATGRFLGAEMIAPDAEHLGHLLAWAEHADFRVQQMLDAPFYHPVVEEGVRHALPALNAQLETQALAPEQCLDCTPAA